VWFCGLLGNIVFTAVFRTPGVASSSSRPSYLRLALYSWSSHLARYRCLCGSLPYAWRGIVAFVAVFLTPGLVFVVLRLGRYRCLRGSFPYAWRGIVVFVAVFRRMPGVVFVVFASSVANKWYPKIIKLKNTHEIVKAAHQLSRTSR